MNHGFVVKLPGQPPSVNSTYKSRMEKATDRNGMPIYNRRGMEVFRPKFYKEKDVKVYQEGVLIQLKAARPSGFHPEGMVYVIYDLFVNRDVDADNVFKAINDSLALAIEINDKMFLPVARQKETGVKEPYVQLTVLDAAYWQVSITPL